MLDALGHYCAGVESGLYREGPCVKAMCRRHLAYLEMSKDPESFPYVYVPEMGQAFARWAYCHRWYQAGFAGQQITYFVAQRAIVDYGLGWQEVEEVDGEWILSGRRMVSRIIIGGGKGMGKSHLLAPLTGYLMECDGAKQLDFGFFAIRQPQAERLLMHLVKILKKSDRWGGDSPWSTKVQNASATYLYHDKGGKLHPYASIGAEGGADGGRQRVVGGDEFANLVDPRIYEELVSGGTATDRDGMLVILASTPGTACRGWGYEQWTGGEKEALRDPTDADPSEAPWIYTMDDAHRRIIVQALRANDANWSDPDVVKALAGRDPETAIHDAVRQACPSLTDRDGKNGTQVYPNIRKAIGQARRKGRHAVRTVLRCFCCMWPEAAGMWLDAAAWGELGSPRTDLDIDKGPRSRAVWAAYSGDARRAAALAVYFPDQGYIATRVYVGTESAKAIDKEQKTDKAWQTWLEEGHLVPDGRDVLTLSPLERDLKALHDAHRVKAGGYHEPVVGTLVARMIEGRDLREKQVPKAVPTSGYGAGAVFLERALAREVDLRHDGNPVVHEAIRTVDREVSERTGVTRPIRGGDHDRVEPAMAVLLALSLGVRFKKKVGAGGSAPPARRASMAKSSRAGSYADPGKRVRR
jgi:phage terminase large subunit-like protein